MGVWWSGKQRTHQFYLLEEVWVRALCSDDYLSKKFCSPFLFGHWDEHLDVADGKEAGSSAHRALVPVVVNLRDQRNEIALLELQLILILRVKVVQRLGAGAARLGGRASWRANRGGKRRGWWLVR